jgi:uncharacterized membrane protein
MGSTTYFLIIAGVIAVVSIPMIANAVPPNRFYGFRTRRTLANERIWYSANRFAGWAMFIAAIISAVALATLPQEMLSAPGYAAGVLVAPLLVAVAASFVHLRGLNEK